MKKIAIIGAGHGGMAAAYDLKKAGHDVTIYEAQRIPVVWRLVLKSRIGIGRWRIFTTTGSPQTGTSWD